MRKTGAIGMGFLGLYQGLAGCSPEFDFGFGQLYFKDGDILSLPQGFAAKIISQRGQLMSDGLISPGNHDGMGAFDLGNHKMILIRNHELSPGAHSSGPFGLNSELIGKVDKAKIYDYAGGGNAVCVGGTTTMVYDELKQEVELEYLSLVGTVRNCSGGITPWDSWITCEETRFLAGDVQGTLEKDHGYNFEVPATVQMGLVDPIPIRAMGRFFHESVAIRPSDGIAYETEDEGNGLLYRYLPDQMGQLEKGGRLQCLAIKEWPGADTRNHPESTGVFPEGRPFDVSWIDLDHVEAPEGDLRLRGQAMGGAIFARGEGIICGGNELYFCATSGGADKNGQIFKYVPSPYEGRPAEKYLPGKLQLFIESHSTDSFQYCDNVTIAPWGDLVVCEDRPDARIIGITPQGRTYVLAQNIGYPKSELTGPVFSPSGGTLFVNIQGPGITVAITGPWKSL